ncbi:DUF3737 family protein [Methanococcus sp. CF]
MGRNTNDNLNMQSRGTIPLTNTKYPECVEQKEKPTVYNELNLDEERALYGVHNATVSNCIFDGPLDGESALKESEDIYVLNCDFRLRYPFWHVKNAIMENSHMTETCRAAIWYSDHMTIVKSHLGGIKALRECEDVTIEDCTIHSPEFGWFSHKITVKNTELESEYPFLQSSDILLDNFVLNGKYSFQYVENVEIKNSRLDTKDAFWHSKNVTVSDSIVKGEYLGWYSENLKLIRCKIIGTQPLCYAEGLVLEDCEMIDCDLSFEYSNVNASIIGSITSVKNPSSGHIIADSIGEIILDENQHMGSSCVIEVKNK